MDYVNLGSSGLKVSRACLGAMNFGTDTNAPCGEDEARRTIDAFLDGGNNFIDTANVYTGGQSEEVVGRAVASKRDDVVIATKARGPQGRGPNDVGTSRKHLTHALEASLRRLGTDYIDVYQMHAWDADTPIDETMATLDTFVRSGKVRYIGCSNYLASQLARAIGRSETLGLARFDSVQPRYNLLYRNCERELLPLCLDDGVGVIPYNPLAGGFLTGKHRPGAPTEGTRFTLGTAAQNYQQRYWNERDFATVEALRKVAADAGMSLTELAVAWCLAQPAITSPIIGASRPDQLAEPVAALDRRLDTDVLEQLDTLTADYRHHPAQR
jgi:aryl-alcohol dehydrogenase (NADP+)